MINGIKIAGSLPREGNKFAESIVQCLIKCNKRPCDWRLLMMIIEETSESRRRRLLAWSEKKAEIRPLYKTTEIHPVIIILHMLSLYFRS